jgi:hypothetical protein
MQIRVRSEVGPQFVLLSKETNERIDELIGGGPAHGDARWICGTLSRADECEGDGALRESGVRDRLGQARQKFPSMKLQNPEQLVVLDITQAVPEMCLTEKPKV